MVIVGWWHTTSITWNCEWIWNLAKWALDAAVTWPKNVFGKITHLTQAWEITSIFLTCVTSSCSWVKFWYLASRAGYTIYTIRTQELVFRQITCIWRNGCYWKSWCHWCSWSGRSSWSGRGGRSSWSGCSCRILWILTSSSLGIGYPSWRTFSTDTTESSIPYSIVLGSSSTRCQCHTWSLVWWSSRAYSTCDTFFACSIVSRDTITVWIHYWDGSACSISGWRDTWKTICWWLFAISACFAWVIRHVYLVWHGITLTCSNTLSQRCVRYWLPWGTRVAVAIELNFSTLTCLSLCQLWIEDTGAQK